MEIGGYERKEGKKNCRRGFGNHCSVTLYTNITQMLLTTAGEDSR